MDDAALVQAAVGGDVPAFTEIFNRYEAQVHDFSLALVRDRSVALAVAQATFREAGERLEQLRQPDRLKVWLLSITRYQAGLQAGAEAGLDRQPAEPPPIQAGEGWTPEDAERAQQAGLVWEATADLPLRERALLDLHLRQGLDGDDLADALGVGPAEAEELRAGMATIEKGLAGYLVVRKADRRCPDLPLVLRGWDGRFNHLVATHIAGHVDSCRVCTESVAHLASPFALYAWAPRTPLPGSGTDADAGATTGTPADDATDTTSDSAAATTAVPAAAPAPGAHSLLGTQGPPPAAEGAPSSTGWTPPNAPAADPGGRS